MLPGIALRILLGLAFCCVLSECQMTSLGKSMPEIYGSYIMPTSMWKEAVIECGILEGYNGTPWIVSVIVLEWNTGNPIQNCVGTLITSRFVVTATHCVRDYIAKAIRFFYIRNHEVHPLVEIENVIYPDNLPRTQPEEIVLLKLKTEVMFSYNVRPICLPPVYVYDERPNSMSRWSFISANQQQTTNIIEYSIEMRSMDRCSSFWPPMLWNYINPSQYYYCAQGVEPCPGDSGSPLIYTDPKSEKKYLFGVVIHGNDCDMRKPNRPFLSARIYPYLSFIRDKIRIN